MNHLSLAPVIVITITAITALMVTLYSWRWRTAPGGIYFSLLMLAVTIYAFTNAAELNSISISSKLIWAKISYLGVVSVAPLWFLFPSVTALKKTGGISRSSLCGSSHWSLWGWQPPTNGMG